MSEEATLATEDALEFESSLMWRHTGLKQNPFREHAPPFVATDLARAALELVELAVEARARRLVIEGESGVGKTALLRTAMARLRRQRVRMAHSSLAAGWDRAIEDLARGLGSHSSGLDPWARLDRCLKAARLERTRVVLALDDCAGSADSEKHLQSLEKLAERGNVPLTLLVSRSGELDDPDDGPEQEKWVALVHPLTRDETDRFLTSKLAAAGCSAPLFTSRAVTRLHGLSRGFPRRIEAMAIECLFRVERLGTPPITADLVDASAAGLA